MRSRAIITVEFPPELARRAKVLGKIYRMSTAQMVRDGLVSKVEALEEKQRREKAEREAAETAKQEKKRRRSLGMPLTPLLSMAPTVPSIPRRDRLDEVYEEHARAIISAGDNREEIRKRAMAAVTAVQHEKPLTAPPEADILATLETHVVRLRNSKAPETRTYDSFVGHVLDLSKIPE